MLVDFGAVPVLSRRTPGLTLKQTESGEIVRMSDDEVKEQAARTDAQRLQRHQTQLILMDRSKSATPSSSASADPFAEGAPIKEASFGVTGLSSVPLPIILAGLGVVGLVAHSMLKK